jgi:hypothetical protein
VEELCGTLVNVKPGNKVELIHHTAHKYTFCNQYYLSGPLTNVRYILNSQFVNKAEVQFELATLCMEYLVFPCFEKNIHHTLRVSFAQQGFYAFQDYAVSRWFYHIAEVVKISDQLLSIDASKAAKFAKVLDDFTERYQDSINDSGFPRGIEPDARTARPENLDEIEENAKNECGKLKGTAFYQMLLNLWIHISKHEKDNIENRNKPSLEEMEKTLKENRGVIESLLGNTKNSSKSHELVEYYGTNLYKCPRVLCDYFYEGFDDMKKRDHHVARHDRPFLCKIPGCGIGAAGFSTSKDLERHQKNYHTGLEQGSGAFPQLSKNKSSEARFSCRICGQKFTRNVNLIGHTRSHYGERPYGCQNCGKKFTRVNDLRRHEKLHLRR